MNLAEAKRVIHDPEIGYSWPKIEAANFLMESCEREQEITTDDLLRCLDYGGVVAEMGARGLYVRTGRDELGWRGAGANGLPFIVDRADWEAYLLNSSVPAPNPPNP
jgi:hypothetical protein